MIRERRCVVDEMPGRSARLLRAVMGLGQFVLGAGLAVGGTILSVVVAGWGLMAAAGCAAVSIGLVVVLHRCFGTAWFLIGVWFGIGLELLAFLTLMAICGSLK